MPYANNGSVRIYFEVIGDGPALVLQHGYTHDLHDWHHHGWVHALQDDYQLILIDARGAGASDGPHDPSQYSMELFAGDVTAVLDQVGVAKAHFLGYSRGSLIGCAVAEFAPQRLLSLILGGHYPHENAQMDDAARAMFGQGMRTYYQGDHSPGLIITPEFLARKLNNDPDALIAAALWPSTVETLASLTVVPCLFFAGTADASCEQVQQLLDRVPHAQFFAVAGLGHGQAFRYSHQVLPQIKQFLREITPPAEQNRAIVRRIIRAFNCGNYEALAQNYHADWRIKGEPSQGVSSVQQRLDQLFSLFPDVEAHVTTITADDTSVTTQWVLQGTTHRASQPGDAADMRRVTVNGSTIDRIQDHKIIESSLQYDAADLARQMGRVPA